MREEIVRLTIKCRLDDVYFGFWEEMTPKQQSVFDNNCTTNCDGGGGLGLWCRGCNFCEDFIEDEE